MRFYTDAFTIRPSRQTTLVVERPFQVLGVGVLQGTICVFLQLPAHSPNDVPNPSIDAADLVLQCVRHGSVVPEDGVYVGTAQLQSSRGGTYHVYMM